MSWTSWEDDEEYVAETDPIVDIYSEQDKGIMVDDPIEAPTDGWTGWEDDTPAPQEDAFDFSMIPNESGTLPDMGQPTGVVAPEDGQATGVVAPEDGQATITPQVMEERRVANLTSDMTGMAQTIDAVRTHWSDKFEMTDQAKDNVAQMNKDQATILKDKFNVELKPKGDGSGDMVFTDLDSGKTYPYEPTILKDIINSKVEVGGSVVGGVVAGAAALALTKNPLIAAGAATLGGAAGGSLGSWGDMAINAAETNQRFTQEQALDRATKVGVEGAIGGYIGDKVAVVAKRIMRGVTPTVQYLKSQLGISDEAANEIITAYGKDFQSGVATTQQKLLALSEQGDGKGRAFIKQAVTEDVESAKALLNNMNTRAIDMNKAVEGNPALSEIVARHTKSKGKYEFIDYNSLAKEVQAKVKAGKLTLNENEAGLIDGMKARWSDQDSDLVGTAYDKTAKVDIGSGAGMFSTKFTDAFKRTFVGKSMNKILDYLTPEIRNNTKVVEGIQQALTKSNDPLVTLSNMAEGTGEVAKAAKQMLQGAKDELVPEEKIVSKVAPDVAPDAQAANEAIEANAKQLDEIDRGNVSAMEEERLIRDKKAKAESIASAEEQAGARARNVEADAKELAEQEKLEGEAILAKTKDDTATAKMDVAEAKVTAKEEGDELLAKAKDETATSKMSEADIDLDTKDAKDDLDALHKAMLKETEEENAEIAEAAAEIAGGNRKQVAEASRKQKEVKKLRDKFEKDASAYVKSLYKKVDQAKTREAKEAVKKEIKETQAKIAEVKKPTFDLETEEALDIGDSTKSSRPAANERIGKSGLGKTATGDEVYIDAVDIPRADMYDSELDKAAVKRIRDGNPTADDLAKLEHDKHQLSSMKKEYDSSILDEEADEAFPDSPPTSAKAQVEKPSAMEAGIAKEPDAGQYNNSYTKEVDEAEARTARMGAAKLERGVSANKAGLDDELKSYQADRGDSRGWAEYLVDNKVNKEKVTEFYKQQGKEPPRVVKKYLGTTDPVADKPKPRASRAMSAGIGKKTPIQRAKDNRLEGEFTDWFTNEKTAKQSPADFFTKSKKRRSDLGITADDVKEFYGDSTIPKGVKQAYDIKD